MMILYRITPTRYFTLRNVWYRKLRDRGVRPGSVFFIPPKPTQVRAWADLLSGEQRAPVYVHRLKVDYRGGRLERFRWRGMEYSQVVIPKRGILSVKVLGTSKYVGG